MTRVDSTETKEDRPDEPTGDAAPAATPEEQLRLRSRQFQTLLDRAPIGVYLIDADFRLVQANPIALPVLSGPADPIGRPWDEILHEMWPTKRAEEIVRAFRRTLETGEPFHAPEFAEHRVDRGVTEYYDWRVERIVLPSGRFGAVCYFQDISPHVTARNALTQLTAESERQRRLYDTIVSSTPDLVYAFDLDYRFTFANRAVLEMWGRSLEDSVGKTLLEIGYEPWHAEMHEREIDRVVATKGPIRGVVSFPHAKLGNRVYDYIFAPVLNERGEVESIAGTTRDVTERMEQEAALRDSEERLRIAAAAAQLGLHDYDVPSGSVQWDRRTRELFGVGPETPITYQIWRECLHPDDLRGAEAAVQRALDPVGDGQYLVQYRVIHGLDGSVRWLEVTGTTTFVGGNPLRLVGTVQDVTKRKRNEEALVEADRRKDEFIATLAHELRNPLAPIRMAVKVLETVRDDPARFDRMVEVVARQSETMARLIDDLMDVSRISRGKIVLRKEWIDVSMLLAQAVEAARPGCDKADLEFSVDLPERPITTEGDPIRLAQVVSNLLSNACKFTDRGRVRVSAERDDGGVMIRVEDTGRGIAPEDQERIFEMFAQADRSRPGSSDEGLGIGLPLVRMLARMHGGDVSVESEPGRGSVFTVHLPIASESETGRPMDASPDRNDGGPLDQVPARHVLVVDDNVDVLHAVEALLRTKGHSVRSVENGALALEAGAESAPEVVILDIGLPDMDGYEVARRMRRTDWGKNTVLIAMTGWGQSRDKARAREAGFDHHLTKPADPLVLERLVARPSDEG